MDSLKEKVEYVIGSVDLFGLDAPYVCYLDDECEAEIAWHIGDAVVTAAVSNGINSVSVLEKTRRRSFEWDYVEFDQMSEFLHTLKDKLRKFEKERREVGCQ